MISAFGVEHGEISKADRPLRKTTIKVSDPPESHGHWTAERLNVGGYEFPDSHSTVEAFNASQKRRREGLWEHDVRASRGGHTAWERATKAYKTTTNAEGPRETHWSHAKSEYIPTMKRPRVRGALGVAAAAGAAGTGAVVYRKKKKR